MSAYRVARISICEPLGTAFTLHSRRVKVPVHFSSGYKNSTFSFQDLAFTSCRSLELNIHAFVQDYPLAVGYSSFQISRALGMVQS